MGCPLDVPPDSDDPNALECMFHYELHTVAADEVVEKWAKEHPEKEKKQ